MTPHHLDISSNVTSFYLAENAPSLESFHFAGWQVLDQFDLRTINYQNLNNMRKHTNIKSGRLPQCNEFQLQLTNMKKVTNIENGWQNHFIQT